jgi:hypothetical protein
VRKQTKYTGRRKASFRSQGEPGSFGTFRLKKPKDENRPKSKTEKLKDTILFLNRKIAGLLEEKRDLEGRIRELEIRGIQGTQRALIAQMTARQDQD